jgi:hypothetical protein
MQCSVTVVNLIHDTATETDRPVCHVIPGSSWREKLDTSGGDPQRTVHIRLPPALRTRANPKPKSPSSISIEAIQ